MKTIVLLGLSALLLTAPGAAQGRWSLEAGGAVVDVNDDNRWAAAVDGHVALDVSSRARVSLGLARWFDPSDTNGNYSWGGIGADLGVAVLLAGTPAFGVRATGVAHGSVGDDGDGTLRVHVGPMVGLQLEARLAGPVRGYVGGAGHVFVTTDGTLDPGGSARAGLAVRI